MRGGLSCYVLPPTVSIQAPTSDGLQTQQTFVHCRFRNLGQTEAQFWDKQVLQQPDPNYQVANDGKGVPRKEGVRNTRLHQLEAPEDVCRDALNPGRIMEFCWPNLHAQGIVHLKAFVQNILASSPQLYHLHH